MRLFVAIDLDEAARGAIAREQMRLASALGERRSSVRWVHPDRMHLTLAFIGEVPEEQGRALAETIGRPIAAAPFEMTLQGAGVFPPHGPPRALWVGVTDGADRLAALHEEITRRVAALGVSLESRPFAAHLTLGRWRQSRPSDRRAVLAASQPDRLARVPVSAATLYQSQISSAGPTYSALARATLTG
jgi:RNA 2',3'-cyclic 3'-phosphodiesterase